MTTKRETESSLLDLIRTSRAVRGTIAAVTIALCAGAAEAQNWNMAGANNNRGFRQQGSRKTTVAYKDNYLYSAVVLQNGAVRIRRKANNVTSGWSTYVSVVNNSSTGLSTIRPTTTVSMAITKAGGLQITWGRYYYPSFFRQYYRCYRIGTGFTHGVQDITSLVGAASTTRTDSMAIAVDGKDFVYMSAQNGTQSWRSRLLQSGFTGYPTGLVPAWTNRGSIAANTASSQNVQMAVSAQGHVQMSFYNNIGNGQYATRAFMQPSTWTTQQQIGVPTHPRDDDGYLATDFSNNTHVLYKHLVTKVGSLITYQLLYRRRSGVGAWSSPIAVDTFTSTEHGSDQPKTSYALASTQKGDRVFAIYRDYKCKRLMVKQKKMTGSSFEFLSELQPKSTLLNDHYMPNTRSTLFPTFNGLVQYLDVTFRRPTGSTYQLWHARLNVGRLNVDKTGCAGTYGVPAITLSGVPASPIAHTLKIGVERAKPTAPAYLVYTFSEPFLVPFAGCNLYASSLLSVQTVNACSNAEVNIPLGAGYMNLWVYLQWGIPDSGASGGWALSNRGKVLL